MWNCVWFGIFLYIHNFMLISWRSFWFTLVIMADITVSYTSDLPEWVSWIHLNKFQLLYLVTKSHHYFHCIRLLYQSVANSFLCFYNGQWSNDITWKNITENSILLLRLKVYSWPFRNEDDNTIFISKLLELSVVLQYLFLSSVGVCSFSDAWKLKNSY